MQAVYIVDKMNMSIEIDISPVSFMYKFEQAKPNLETCNILSYILFDHTHTYVYFFSSK